MWEFLTDFISSVLGGNVPPPPQEPIGPPALPPAVQLAMVPADRREADILAQLHPEFAKRVSLTLQKCREAGLVVYVFEGMRSIERQKELYAKGRDAHGNVVDKKLVVTNAKPGLSLHAYGVAADLVFDGIPSTPKIDWSWDLKLPWWKMGKIAQDCGLEWAGAWSSFPEMPHIQMPTPGLKAKDLLALYTRGGMSAVWAKIS